MTKKINKWKISTFVLLILLVVVFATSGETFSLTSGASVTGNAVSFINSNLLQGQTATVVDVSSKNGLYKATIDIQGQPGEIYVTRDGKLMFLQAIPLDAEIPTGPAEVQRLNIELNSNDHILGDENAPVTIVEYSDFECSFCSKFYKDTIGQIKETYVDTGIVKFVYRHFPLSGHSKAQKAAEASECAGEQGKFWEMHDLMFETGLLTIDDLKQHAITLSLDTTIFNDCLDSGKYEEKVNADFSLGQQHGVSGTPASFVNGILVSGAQPFSKMQQTIEAELAS